jgi:hypothetical protein
MARGAGAKRHPIRFEKKGAAQKNDFGEDITPWEPVVPDVWAQIEPVSLRSMAGAREATMSGANTNTDLVQATVYPVAGLNATWRFTDLVTDVIYDIKTVRPANDNSEVTLIAEVGATNG